MLNPDAEDLKPFLLLEMRGLRVWGLLVAMERLGGGVVDVDVDDALTGMWVARVGGGGIVSVSRAEEGASSLELTGAAKVPVGTRSMAATTSSTVELRPRKPTISTVPYSLKLMASSFRNIGLCGSWASGSGDASKNATGYVL